MRKQSEVIRDSVTGAVRIHIDASSSIQQLVEHFEILDRQLEVQLTSTYLDEGRWSLVM